MKTILRKLGTKKSAACVMPVCRADAMPLKRVKSRMSVELWRRGRRRSIKVVQPRVVWVTDVLLYPTGDGPPEPPSVVRFSFSRAVSEVSALAPASASDAFPSASKGRS